MTKLRRRYGTNAEDAFIDMSNLDSTIGFLLKRAQMAVSREIHAIFAEFDITTVQFSVLTVASDNPGLAQADLAAAIEVERPRIVPVLDTLVARGLTERRQDTRDGRARRIYVTDDGATMLTKLRRQFDGLESQLETKLSGTLGDQAREGLLEALRCLAAGD